MTQDLIRYDVLVQEALRGVVRKVIGEVTRTGLPGEHHFFISFDTQHPGVRLSARMRQRYPEEMTIVLQHQFWDLAVSEQALEVGLSFNGIPEKLLVPFSAVKGFFDPSVQFGLQFEVARESADDVATEPAAPAKAPSALPASAIKPIAEKPAEAPRQEKPSTRAEAPKPKLVAKSDDKTSDAPGATVLSLDNFRKKP